MLLSLCAYLLDLSLSDDGGGIGGGGATGSSGDRVSSNHCPSMGSESSSGTEKSIDPLNSSWPVL